MIDWQSHFDLALTYDAFLERHGSASDRKRWTEVLNNYRPTEQHRTTLGTFVRDMNVLCLAGAWCGDCVDQCPVLEHFARIGPRIQLRFADRDANPMLAEELRICGGARVPVVVFLSEDFAECGRYGDRTLSRYRQLARDQVCSYQGPAAAASDFADDWLREFERIQLMLRVSPRLRQRHGD